MSSGQVPLWVPLLVALLGFIGVLGAQLIAGRREDRRWRRENEREELRWARERENRSYEGRAQAYAEVVGAIEAFDWVLYQARHGDVDDTLVADLRAAATQARNALGGVNVHAPEKIRATLRHSMLRRSSLSTQLIAGQNGPEQDKLWHEGLREYRLMRAAMRRDLGLDAEVTEKITENVTEEEPA